MVVPCMIESFRVRLPTCDVFSGRFLFLLLLGLWMAISPFQVLITLKPIPRSSNHHHHQPCSPVAAPGTPDARTPPPPSDPDISASLHLCSSSSLTLHTHRLASSPLLSHTPALKEKGIETEVSPLMPCSPSLLLPR